MAQVVRPAPDLVALRRERGLLIPQAVQRRVRLRHRRALGLRVGECVEDVALGVGVEQRLGLVLAVEIHQQRAELAEHRGGGRAAVHPRPRAALGRDLAPHDQPSVLEIEAEGFDPLAGDLVDPLERALDDGLRGAGTHAAAGGALAEQQRERIHQHGLPRPGLAGEDVEAGAEMEGDVGDGGEVADAELGDHASDRFPLPHPEGAND